MENGTNDRLAFPELEIDNEVRHDFNEAAKWSKFLSVTVFVFAGLLLLVAIAGGSAILSSFNRYGGYRMRQYAEMGGPVIIGIIVVTAIIIAVVYYFLYRFAVKTKAALFSENIAEMNIGLNSLKTFFIVTTIFSVLALLLNVYSIINNN